ncbi:unnamed protein product [Rotaria magnacalcarata]
MIIESCKIWYAGGGNNMTAIQQFHPELGTPEMHDILAVYLAASHTSVDPTISMSRKIFVTNDGYILENETIELTNNKSSGNESEEYDYTIKKGDELDRYRLFEFDKKKVKKQPLDFWKNHQETFPHHSKKMTTRLVSPSSPTGNNRSIELAGIDLWTIARVDKVFLYPVELNVDRFKESLGHTLSIWSIIAAHFLVLDDDHYVIEMSEYPIPVSFVKNTVLIRWPFNLNVVTHLIESSLSEFIDEVRTEKLVDRTMMEPLFRLKLTRIVTSDELVLGASGSHMRIYQQMEPAEPFHIFERRLWRS